MFSLLPSHISFFIDTFCLLLIDSLFFTDLEPTPLILFHVPFVNYFICRIISHCLSESTLSILVNPIFPSLCRYIVCLYYISNFVFFQASVSTHKCIWTSSIFVLILKRNILSVQIHVCVLTEETIHLPCYLDEYIWTATLPRAADQTSVAQGTSLPYSTHLPKPQRKGLA